MLVNNTHTKQNFTNVKTSFLIFQMIWFSDAKLATEIHTKKKTTKNGHAI